MAMASQAHSVPPLSRLLRVRHFVRLAALTGRSPGMFRPRCCVGSL